jgi:hypothetical protein
MESVANPPTSRRGTAIFLFFRKIPRHRTHSILAHLDLALAAIFDK